MPRREGMSPLSVLDTFALRQLDLGLAGFNISEFCPQPILVDVVPKVLYWWLWALLGLLHICLHLLLHLALHLHTAFTEDTVSMKISASDLDCSGFRGLAQAPGHLLSLAQLFPSIVLWLQGSPA